MARMPAFLVLAGIFAAVPLPAGAQAASRTVKVPISKNGEVTLARYAVKMGARARLRVRVQDPRLLGDARVGLSSRRTGRRSIDLAVYVLNPRGGASSAQRQGASARIKLSSHVPIIPKKNVTLRNALRGDRGPKQNAAAGRFCDKTPPPKLRITRALDVFLCQDGRDAAIVSARDLLKRIGLAPPDCAGVMRPLPGGLPEVAIRIICFSAGQKVFAFGPPGTTATNCLVDPPARCATGDACESKPPNVSCFAHPEAFPLRQAFEVNTHYGFGPARFWPPASPETWAPFLLQVNAPISMEAGVSPFLAGPPLYSAVVAGRRYY